jgi:hypothetical protein
MRIRDLTAFVTPILLFLGLVWLAAPTVATAGTPKVEVCHFPPGNPDNFHTITISENALSAHLAHDDLTGACNALCADICDDQDACTVDDTGDCEQNGCPVARDPVDCSDSLNCTTDGCDSANGCSNDPVECTPLDLCHVSECAEPEGTCMETPVVCGDGEACNPDNGQCESAVECPCLGLVSTDGVVWDSSFRVDACNLFGTSGLPNLKQFEPEAVLLSMGVAGFSTTEQQCFLNTPGGWTSLPFPDDAQVLEACDEVLRAFALEDGNLEEGHPCL